MTFEILNTGSPTSASFTLTSRTTVQFSQVGGARANSTGQVVLKVDIGSSDFRDYGITIPRSEPMDVILAPNTYQLDLINAQDVEGDVVVSVSPNS